MLNTDNIGGNITEEIKNLVSGDFEIGGKKIPKVAVIAVAGGAVVLLVLMNKKSGGSSLPFQSKTDQSGDSTSGIITNDSPVGGSAGEGGSSTDFTQQLSDLQDLIAESTAQNASDFANQLGGLQSQIDSLNTSYPVNALPVDSGYGLGGYDYSYSEPSYQQQGYGSFQETPIPSVKPGKISTSLDFVDSPLIKPSKIKPEGGKSSAKLGAQLTKPTGKISQLSGSAPKLSAVGSFKPSAVTGFSKQPTVKPPVMVKPTASGKKQFEVVSQPSNKSNFQPQASPKKKSFSMIAINKQPQSAQPKPPSKPTGSYSGQASPKGYVPMSYKPLGFSAIPKSSYRFMGSSPSKVINTKKFSK